MLFDDRVYCPYHFASFSVKTGYHDFGPVFKGIPTYELVVKENKVYAKVPQRLLQKKDVQSEKVEQVLGDKNFVIIGAGPAGMSAAETLRQSGFAGKITLISKDTNLPYDRTLLSKVLMKSKPENFALRKQEFFDKHGIEILLGEEVTKVCKEKKSV